MHSSSFIEPLEGRQLLSSVALASGTLTITGNSTVDRIEVQKRADQGKLKVEINGSEKKFTLSAVHKIVIKSNGGNDFIDFSGRDGGVKISSFIDAGSGNDTVHGSEANDTLLGNTGNDLIQGKGGNDSISGGSGNDRLEGGAGNDTLKGDAGNDVLFGGDNNDSLSGGDGDDDLHGDAGDDRLFGNAGNDDFFDVASQLKDKGGADDGATHP